MLCDGRHVSYFGFSQLGCCHQSSK